MPILADSTCTTNAGTVTSPSNCSLASVGSLAVGSGSASASGSVTAGISGNTFSFGGSATAEAMPTVNNNPFPSLGDPINTASANFSIRSTIDTAGPLRTGYVLFVVNALAGKSAGNGGANPFAVLGQHSSGACAPLFSAVVCNGTNSGLQPIELGTAIPFSESVSAWANSGDGLGQGDANLSGSIRFFEADGTTPVGLIDSTTVPEPGTLALWAAGLLGVGLWRRRAGKQLSVGVLSSRHFR